VDPIGRIHQGLVYDRRTRVLAKHLAAMLPDGARVLDVGCGDGRISQLVASEHGNLGGIHGIDVLVRPDLHIPVEPFDGLHIPFEADSFDVVMFVDVLHHTPDPTVLLREAARVARRSIVLKDHLLEGAFAMPTLKFMDWVGNARHGVALPYNYWTRAQWTEALTSNGLEVDRCIGDLDLYGSLAGLLFDRSLHFVARLTVGNHSAPSGDR
jgi:SAM-dependent methyltransferase